MKKKIIIPKVVLILSLVLILTLWPIIFLASNSSIWFLMQKEKVSLSEEEVKAYNKQIISFFRGEVKNLGFLTGEEFSHIQDVKNLIVKASLSFWSALILFLPTCVYLGKSIRFILRRVSIAVLFFLLLLLIASIVNFPLVFLKFHEIFFISNYAFPSTSMLKILYPDSFYRDIFIVYFLLSIVGCLVVTIISYRLKV